MPCHHMPLLVHFRGCHGGGYEGGGGEVASGIICFKFQSTANAHHKNPHNQESWIKKLWDFPFTTGEIEPLRIGICLGKAPRVFRFLAIGRMRGAAASATGSARSRESTEVRESTRVVLGNIRQKGVARCSLDSCLLLSSFFA